MKIGIGIDTGGTYTDSVIYDFDEKKILASAKALTTKNDLSIGILQSLDALPSELIVLAEIVSLSTTLATNACIEEKGGNAKLVFLGVDEKIINNYGEDYGLPKADKIYIQDCYTKFSGEIVRTPDWALFRNNLHTHFTDLDGVGIVEINSMSNGAVNEKKAKELLESSLDIPVVCGHELFSDLNCLQRGASTLLNARLFPIIKEFLVAIKLSLAKRNINAAIVIVRSDGSLMTEKFAALRPVETLLCGPAASVIGAASLIDEKNSIIIDMGGTTSDIAIVKNEIPVKVTGGISIGKWKTFVKGLYINTFGLGGDTAVHFDEYNIYLEDYRVVPLCVASSTYPIIVEKLNELLTKTTTNSKFMHEFYILVKDISASQRYTSEEKTFCLALKNGPLILADAAKAIGKDAYNFNISRLIKEGVVQVCGLTPTDIMHIKNDFNKYDVVASKLGAKYIATNLDISIDEVCDRVYDEVKRRLYVNIVKVMLENEDNFFGKSEINDEIIKFINHSYDIAKTEVKNEFIDFSFKTKFALVGIGAPIHIFLSDVAKMLGTKAVIPKYYEVANAIGAITSKIHATNTIEITPINESGGTVGYTVHASDGAKIFEDIDEAKVFAKAESRDGAYNEAIQRGAVGEIAISVTVKDNEAQARNCTIFLGTTVTANAVGTL